MYITYIKSDTSSEHSGSVDTLATELRQRNGRGTNYAFDNLAQVVAFFTYLFAPQGTHRLSLGTNMHARVNARAFAPSAVRARASEEVYPN